jgi:cytochrome c oxidase cbb3-type subunit 3
MTLSHSLFIIVLTIGNIAGALWLLWWMRRSRGETLKTTETTGHVWDGDLRELNNPLPRWWLWLFIITVVFGGVYLALYPGLGSYQGTLGWTSQREHATQFAANAARLEKTLAPYATRSVEELSGDARALDIGRNLFLNNCATCHGSDGGGAPGYPNLTDKDWLWGGDPDRVLETVANGRMGVMPAWGEALGPEGTENVLAYVYSLRGQSLPAGNVQAGAAKFAELCSACHGADARGNPALGAPNLTDGVWLHGGALASVRQSIEKGRNGLMPAHLQRLGETRVKLLAAYALSLGRALDETPVAAASGSGGGHAAAGR